MKNIEKYEHEISKLVNEGDALPCAIATAAGIRKQDPCSRSKLCDVCNKKCIEWMWSEYNEPILSDEEKDIVKSMVNIIHKFGCEVNYVYKSECSNGYCFIGTTFKDSVTGSRDLIDSPYFDDDMFKGMKFNKEYKLEELGISCQTQKDS